MLRPDSCTKSQLCAVETGWMDLLVLPSSSFHTDLLTNAILVFSRLLILTIKAANSLLPMTLCTCSSITGNERTKCYRQKWQQTFTLVCTCVWIRHVICRAIRRYVRNIDQGRCSEGNGGTRSEGTQHEEGCQKAWKFPEKLKFFVFLPAILIFLF